MSSGTFVSLPAPVDVEIEGPKLEVSQQLAARLRARFQRIAGVVDVRTPQVLQHPALHLEVDRERALQLGIT